jgi:hypothetical protein
VDEVDDDADEGGLIPTEDFFSSFEDVVLTPTATEVLTGGDFEESVDLGGGATGVVDDDDKIPPLTVKRFDGGNAAVRFKSGDTRSGEYEETDEERAEDEGGGREGPEDVFELVTDDEDCVVVVVVVVVGVVEVPEETEDSDKGICPYGERLTVGGGAKVGGGGFEPGVGTGTHGFEYGKY